MDLVYAATIMIALIAVWYWRDPDFTERLDRLGQDAPAGHEQPPDGAIDDYIGWSDGE
jgi:hypothetical protein